MEIGVLEGAFQFEGVGAIEGMGGRPKNDMLFFGIESDRSFDRKKMLRRHSKIDSFTYYEDNLYF